MYIPIWIEPDIGNLSISMIHNITKEKYIYPIKNISDVDSYIKFELNIEDIDSGEYTFNIMGVNSQLKQIEVFKGLMSLNNVNNTKYLITNNYYEPKKFKSKK